MNECPYWDKLPNVERFTINFSKQFGSGDLLIEPQVGPQRAFISCMAGLSGQEERDNDFYLIFYGGAR